MLGRLARLSLAWSILIVFLRSCFSCPVVPAVQHSEERSTCTANRLVFRKADPYTVPNKQQQSRTGEKPMSRLSVVASFVGLLGVACLAAGPSKAQQAAPVLT